MSATTQRRPRRGGVSTKGSKRRGDALTAYLMLAPVVIMLGIFVIWPLLSAVQLSLYDWSFYKPSVYVGLRNYTNVLTDPMFSAAVLRGITFVLMTVPIGIVLSFLFASFVVSTGRRLAEVLKVAVYIPTIISGVITSITFSLIYDYSGGLLNAILLHFGHEPEAWLGDPKWALAAIAVPAVWLGTGLTSLIMVAAMVDVPESFYESASLDGANWWQKTRYITIPQLKNVLLYLIITGFVAAIQQYELPLVMTGGGPMDATSLPNLFIFNHFRGDPYVGYSVAAALLMFVVLGAVSALIFRLMPSDKLVD